MRLWPHGGLWRHRDFLKLWSAETVSVFGSQFSGLALPLVAVLLLDASPFAVSALVVVEFLPFILGHREGLRFVIGNPYLRAISTCTGTSNFFWSMGGALLVVYTVRELEMSPALLGLAFSLGNAGPLLAALTTSRISSRLGVGPNHPLDVDPLLGVAPLRTARLEGAPAALPRRLRRARRLRGRLLQHHAGEL